MKIHLRTLLFVSLAPLVNLGGCACGSGGCPGVASSGSNNPSTPSNPSGFTSFAAVPKPGTTTIPGITTEGSFIAPAPTFQVTSHSSPSSGTGTVTLSLDAGGNVTSLTLNGAQSTVVFNQANGSTTGTLAAIGAPNATYALSADGTKLAIGANYAAMGFNYQTFGIWGTGIATGSGNIGSISAGAATPNGAVPTTGTGTYVGTAGGVYVNRSGSQYLAAGTANLVANFGASSVNYSTSNTSAIAVSDGSLLPNPQILNMQGTLSYSAGTNLFSGNVTSSGMQGTARGRFYGPAATEVGGTFVLTNGPVEGYLGAFGAK